MSLPTTPCRRAAPLAALLLCLCAGPAAADPDARAEREIDHLLDYVAGSNCTFLRGDTAYPATVARAHLAMKYRWTKGRLSTADEFVRYLATDSSSTGERYKMVCNQQESYTGPWLEAELQRFRTRQAAATR